MRKNANFANHKCALRCALLINMLKLKQLVSNLYHLSLIHIFAKGKRAYTDGVEAWMKDGSMVLFEGHVGNIPVSYTHL